MKGIKVVYNEDTKFILEILEKIPIKFMSETHNTSFHKNKKKAYEIMERYGTRNFPLLVFEDENLEEYGAIWSESKPDWEKEIIKKLSSEF